MRPLARISVADLAPFGAAAILACWAVAQFLAPLSIDVSPPAGETQLAEVPTPPQRAESDVQGSMATILARPVFHRDRRPAASGDGHSVALASIRLEGTVVLQKVKRALIRDASNPDSAARWYEVGAVFGEWRIVAIEPGRVSFGNASQVVALSIAGEEETQATMSSQQRNATPIYLPDRPALSAEDALRRRAALEALYPADSEQPAGRGKYE